MIDPALSLSAALLVGLFGSVHCAAMCGGLASALAFSLPRTATAGERARFLATVSAGRILGYGAIGALAGGAGFTIAAALGPGAAIGLRALAGFGLVAIALTIGGWARIPVWIERAGAQLWRRLQPLAVALRGDLRTGRALLLGFVWGWLPCGLVYGALGWAATSARPLSAALLMMAFGLGTLPGVVLPAAAAQQIGGWFRGTASRRAAATVLAGFGLWTLVGAAVLAHDALAGEGCHEAPHAEAVVR